MRHISEGAYELVMSRGIANGRAGTRDGRGMKERGAASDGAHSRVETTDREGGQSQSPIGRQGGTQPMGMRKSPGDAGAGSDFNGLGEKPKEPTPFDRRVPLLVVDNSRCMPLRDPTRSAQRGSGIHLVLV